MFEEVFNKLFNDSIIENINKESYLNIFKLPIELINNKILINQNIIKDLELLNDNDNDTYSLYHNVFDKQTLFGGLNLDLWSKYYTNDINFLLDSQKLYKTYNDVIIDDNNNIDDNDIFKVSTETIEDDAFIERFHYIDLPIFKDLNKNETVIYNFSLS